MRPSSACGDCTAQLFLFVFSKEKIIKWRRTCLCNCYMCLQMRWNVFYLLMPTFELVLKTNEPVSLRMMNDSPFVRQTSDWRPGWCHLSLRSIRWRGVVLIKHSQLAAGFWVRVAAVSAARAKECVCGSPGVCLTCMLESGG